MSQSQPAFGGMLRQLVDLGVITIDTEPLDAAIERRLKQFWEQTACPQCDQPSIRTWPSSDRIICRNCGFKPRFTYGTPFHEKHLSSGEVLLAFLLYADTLLNITQIAVLLERASLRSAPTALRSTVRSSGLTHGGSEDLTQGSHYR